MFTSISLSSGQLMPVRSKLHKSRHLETQIDVFGRGILEGLVDSFSEQ